MFDNFKGNSANKEAETITAKMCFDVLTEEQKAELINNKVEVEFKAGETILKRGFVVSSIIFLEEGLVKLDILNDGHIATVALVAPKSFVGITCTFGSHNLDFSATAIEKTKVSLIDIGLFEKFVKQNGEFACHLIKHMSSTTSRLVHTLARFSHKNINGSLSILLTDFSHIYKSDSFTLPVNRIEIANMLGYSKESVINTLSKFNKEGIVRVRDKNIQILDKKRLIQIGELA